MAIRKPGAVVGTLAENTPPTLEAAAKNLASQLPGAKQVESQSVGTIDTSAEAAKVDYKAEERSRIAGQVRMHCVVAALQSPAGPAFAPTEEAYMALVLKLADLAFEYTFKGEQR